MNYQESLRERKMNRIYRLLLAVLVFIAIAILSSLLGGCSALKIDTKRCSAPGVCSEVKVNSRYEFENGLDVVFNTETKAFEVHAGSATKQGIDPVLGVLIQEMLKILRSLYPVPNLTENPQ